ncbi:hypothetical protein [Autumnicola musiva]|uniref:Uncharacterized protein n=1 Tax=Autumnicola musiva TaxID=3075589 RepID=A0ABU3DAE7_9FLAO|nr:hypothetical protein [Zunongwangia sp. F117]MDT0678517.1 hypothetical protein [Zunongwangia sp. F117]
MSRNLLILTIMLLTLKGYSQEMPTKGHIFNSILGSNSEPAIYNAVNLNTYELLTTNIQVSKEDNLQKIVFLPLKLMTSKNIGFLRETKINIAQKNGISTFGLGIGFDSSSPFSKRGTRILNEAFSGFPAQRPKGETEKDYEYEIYKSKYYYSMDSTYAETYEKLLRKSFKVTIGYNISLFEVIGGDKVDLDNDDVIDNYFVTESNNFSMYLTYIFSSKTAISINGHYSSALASPKQNEKQVEYLGGSFSFAQRLCVLNKKYRKTPDYLKTLFVPSIVGGASIEFKDAVSNIDFVKNGITETLAITPYLEFKINPKNQFRAGVPIKKFEGIKEEISFGPFIQWTLQIAKVD